MLSIILRASLVVLAAGPTFLSVGCGIQIASDVQTEPGQGTVFLGISIDWAALSGDPSLFGHPSIGDALSWELIDAEALAEEWLFAEVTDTFEFDLGLDGDSQDSEFDPDEFDPDQLFEDLLNEGGEEIFGEELLDIFRDGIPNPSDREPISFGQLKGRFAG